MGCPNTHSKSVERYIALDVGSVSLTRVAAKAKKQNGSGRASCREVRGLFQAAR